MDELEFQDFVTAVTGSDLKQMRAWLDVLNGSPSGDPRVLPYLEALLDNQTLCIVSIPYYFSEVRFLAAKALVWERAKQGIDIPIIITVVQPINAVQISNLASEAGMESLVNEDIFAKLKKLIDLNKVPMLNLELDPKEKRD